MKRGLFAALDRLVYGCVWLLGNLLLRVWFRLRIENRPQLRGPFVLAANHASFLDPIVLSAALPRRVRFMMSEAFYRSPRLGWFYRWSRAIPVSLRGGNRDAMRAARDALADGAVVGIFPEGGITRDGKLYLGNPGAVSLVLSAGVPIVPAGIVGLHHAYGVGHRGLPRLSRVTVRFGAPITPVELVGAATARKAQLGVATERIMAEIATLLGTTSREAELAALAADRG